jgi:hypothetical protein
MAVENPTRICNQALARIGSARIDNIDTDSSPEAIQCNIHYEATRDALLRRHQWGFAAARAALAQSTTTPAFGFAYQYPLPSDFMKLRAIYGDGGTRRNNSVYSHKLEAGNVLSDDSSMKILYTAKITDAGKFDPMFVECIVLRLALKLMPPLTNQAGSRAAGQLATELQTMMPSVWAMDRDEQELLGRDDQATWLDARWDGNSGRLLHRMGS